MHFPVYEAIMLLCFGVAWPFSILRSWRARTSKGKSAPFLFVILVGYAAGILNKVTLGQHRDPVLGLYVLNLLMVSLDTALYFRNRRLDAAR
ncbi:MAG: hypothetical protein WCK89_11955 [bacterium]